jgi:hypothetical protein
MNHPTLTVTPLATGDIVIIKDKVVTTIRKGEVGYLASLDVYCSQLWTHDANIRRQSDRACKIADECGIG